MTVDAATRAVMDEMSRVFPPIGTIPAAEARQRIRAMAARPRTVAADTEDRTIPGPGGPLPIRIYRPPGAERPAGSAAVFFHGGGWVIGDLDSHDGTCRALAVGARTVVVAVDYRLAPEWPFPAAVDDAEAATRWVDTHRRELGLAADAALAVAGDSAGGNLAAAVALRACRGGPTLDLQVLIYPVLDSGLDTGSYRDFGDGYFLTRAHMAWYWEQYVPDRARRRHPHVAPLQAEDLAGVAPAHIVTGECDPLRDEAEAYARRLRQAGVAVTNVRYGGLFHGFLALAEMLPGPRQAMADLCAAVQAGLAGGR